VLRREADVSTRVRESGSLTKSSSGASGAPEEELQEEERFKRFSAYANDRRVTASGAILPGTYATTEEDAKHVKTGRDAVKAICAAKPCTRSLCVHDRSSAQNKPKARRRPTRLWTTRRRRGSYFCERFARPNCDRPCADSTMTIRLPEKWTRFLVHQPESGMGYQRVDVRLANNREIKDAVVFNAEEIELPDDCAHSEIKDIQLHH
jgi:hypothetical protein